MKFHLLLVPLFLSLILSFSPIAQDHNKHQQATIFNHCDAGTAPLYINEFMAANAYSHSDENGEYDDWLEIYNAGSGDVYLGDKYLSDDHSVPNKWLLPDVSIGPGEFMVFWCDEDQSQGDFHTNFKLNRTGEQLGIWDNETSGYAPIDTFTYGEIGQDMPWGLYPNGEGEITALSWRTPGASNVPLSTASPEAKQITVAPNPVSDLLRIDAAFPIASIKIISVDGKVWEKEGLGQQTQSINFSDFATGIYTLQVFGQKKMEQIKIIKP